MPLDLRLMTLKLAEIELSRIDGLTDLINDGVTDELNELRLLGGEEDEGLEFYADEAHELADIDALFTRLSVIALYAIVETRTKGLIAWSSNSQSTKHLFRFVELKRTFARLAGMELSDVAHYAAVDELRCLNNDVKHNGTVTAELARYPGWKEGEAIGDVREVVARIRHIVPSYLQAVSTALASPVQQHNTR